MSVIINSMMGMMGTTQELHINRERGQGFPCSFFTYLSSYYVSLKHNHFF